MSAVDAYLADLRAALGDRLPPSVGEARLREARSHLLASAQEVSVEEAVRRFGRARAVASGLVRAHRGYDAKSVWALALPWSAAFYGAGLLGAVASRLAPRGWEIDDLVLHAVLPAIGLGFVARSLQTRRWLAGPMLLSHVAGIMTMSLYAVLALHRNSWSRDDWARSGVTLSVFAAIWFALNALTLVLGRGLDLLRVRRAGGAR